jgi:hypothetical protein
LAEERIEGRVEGLVKDLAVDLLLGRERSCSEKESKDSLFNTLLIQHIKSRTYHSSSIVGNVSQVIDLYLMRANHANYFEDLHEYLLK